MSLSHVFPVTFQKFSERLLYRNQAQPLFLLLLLRLLKFLLLLLLQLLACPKETGDKLRRQTEETPFFNRFYSHYRSVLIQGWVLKPGRALIRVWTGNLPILSVTKYVKSIRFGISGPYFPAFGLNTKIYRVNLRIQPKCGKMRTRKIQNKDTVHTMTP